MPRLTKLDDYDQLANRQDKSKMIEKYKESIKKLRAQIEVIKSDKDMTTLDKQRKIARREEIIENYKQDIFIATEFLRCRKEKEQEIYNKFTKSK